MRAFLKTVVLAAGVLGIAAAASAQTVANTEVTSTATLDYRGKDDTTTQSAETTFRVDRVINFTVVSTRVAGVDGASFDLSETPSETVAQPGATANLTYTITNTGNEALRFAFYQLDPDEYSAQNTTIDGVDFVASVTGSVSGGGQAAAVNTATGSTDYSSTSNVIAVDVAVGGDLVITAPAVVPEGAAFDTRGIHALAVQAVQPATFADETTNTGNAGSVWTASETNGVETTDTVFADQNYTVVKINEGFNEVVTNAVVVAVSEIGVSDAGLTVAKVISGLAQDGTNCSNLSEGLDGVGTDEFFLPGACVEYTITVSPTTDGTTVNDISISEPWTNSVVSFEGIEIAGDFNSVNGGNPAQAAATPIAVDADGSETATLLRGNVAYECAANNACTLTVSGMSIADTDAEQGAVDGEGTIKVRYRVRS